MTTTKRGKVFFFHMLRVRSLHCISLVHIRSRLEIVRGILSVPQNIVVHVTIVIHKHVCAPTLNIT